MTLPTTECTKPYATNGSQTVFPITFPFHDESHIKVFVLNNATNDEQELGNPEDFSVIGSNVVTTAVWPSGYTLLIMRAHPYTQDLDLLEGGKLPAEPLEKRVDKNVMMIQQILEMLSRIPKFKKTTSYKDIEMSDPAEGHFLLFQSGVLRFVQHFGPSDYVIQTFMKTFLESTNLAEAHENLQRRDQDIDHGGLAGLGDDDHTQYLLKSSFWPVGSVYVQYATSASNDAATALPSSEAPASLFGGTWEKLWDSEGADFHTEGYDGAGRTDGLMEDQFQGHDHYFLYNSTWYMPGASQTIDPGGYYRLWATNNHNVRKIDTDGTNGTPRIGTRTSDRNRLMRIWRRTA